MAVVTVIGYRDLDLLQQFPDIISIDIAIYFKNKIITYNQRRANTVSMLLEFIGEIIFSFVEYRWGAHVCCTPTSV